MNHGAAARAESHRAPRLALLGLAMVIAVIAGTLGNRSVSMSLSAASVVDVPGGVLGDPRHGPLSEADGLVGANVTIFDDDVPAVAKLDPGLLAALRRAATDAEADGVELVVNSGWRSPEYQEQLLREAIARYGSEAKAARWVGTPSTSAHVSGDAVDIGPVAATVWLSRHGARYGLCQIYRNEPWHFELRAEAESRRCPRMYADPAHDPRMRE